MSRGYKRILIIANGVDIIVLGKPFFNDIGADKLCFIWNWKQLALSVDGLPETSSSDNIAVTESSARSFNCMHAVFCA